MARVQIAPSLLLVVLGATANAQQPGALYNPEMSTPCVAGDTCYETPPGAARSMGKGGACSKTTGSTWIVHTEHWLASQKECELQCSAMLSCTAFEFSLMFTVSSTV